jgi:ATP-binding cassette subfamily E protein 1
MPFGVREGINIFLAGFIPTENLRFRDIGLTFKVAENVDEVLEQEKHHCMNSYGDMTKTMQRAGSESKFVLRLQKGSFNDSEIVVLLGENGTGKTTFIRLLAGLIQADDGARVPEMRVSYKPQTVSPKFEGTVRQLLQKKIMESFMHPQFNTDVIKPLSIEGIIDQEVQHLSGGEIQRVALILALGAPAEIYLIDEPSACVSSPFPLRIFIVYLLHSPQNHHRIATLFPHHFYAQADTSTPSSVSSPPASSSASSCAFRSSLNVFL